MFFILEYLHMYEMLQKRKINKENFAKKKKKMKLSKNEWKYRQTKQEKKKKENRWETFVKTHTK